MVPPAHLEKLDETLGDAPRGGVLPQKKAQNENSGDKPQEVLPPAHQEKLNCETLGDTLRGG